MVVDVRLQEARADGALRAELLRPRATGTWRLDRAASSPSATAATLSRLATIQCRRGWPESDRSVRGGEQDGDAVEPAVVELLGDGERAILPET